MTKAVKRQPNVLDPAQLIRIEAVHRGFLFQHLYTVQCLLSASVLSVKSVEVETDEDIEVQLQDKRIYVQVKHRKEALAWGDIEDALTRFGQLRTAHERGDRCGEAEFLIITNAAPNAPLASRLTSADWPADVRVDWPLAKSDNRILPVPQSSLIEAAEAATKMAKALPFATLAPDTLVWKMAGVVSLAATGDRKDLNHVFMVDKLSNIFEQVIIQLQDLPLPPSPYRVQEQEPELLTEERVRLIIGHSGAGKTSWLAQSAQHASGTLIYLDVADTPGAALANTVAREVAGRIFESGRTLGEILLPGASGREILQIISRRLAKNGEIVTVALDNIHQLTADDLLGVTRHANKIRFVLLGRPEGEVPLLEAALGVSREVLLGWAPDTIAAAAHHEGCHGDAADCQRLIDLTGGLPLFVMNAISVAKSDYDGSLKRLCADLARSAHTREIAQDFILGRVFDRLPAAVAKIAELISLCDAPLDRKELLSYVVAAGSDQAFFDRALRHLISHGLLQVYARNRIKLHDAARAVGKGRLLLRGSDFVKTHQVALRSIVQDSLQASWHPSKFSLFLRLTGEVGRLDILVEMATDELFHEMGVWPEVEFYLVNGAQDDSVSPDLRIKALDGLAFADLKSGSERAALWLDKMDTIVTAHNLGAEEQLRVGMKRMSLLAGKGDRFGAMHQVSQLSPLVKDLPPSHQRVFSYNVACAELVLGDAKAAAERVQPLIKKYYDLIGLSPEMVLGNNAPELARMMKQEADVDDIKHLADSLDVFAKACDLMGYFPPFARIHALKFYDLARAPESLFRVGQDLVDQFIRKSDFDGALNIMETIILPQLQQWKIADYLISVRSQYAVVLAYCERYSEAEAEMVRLAPYKASLAPNAQIEIDSQNELIAALKVSGPPPKWTPPPGLLENIADYFDKSKISN